MSRQRGGTYNGGSSMVRAAPVPVNVRPDPIGPQYASVLDRPEVRLRLKALIHEKALSQRNTRRFWRVFNANYENIDEKYRNLSDNFLIGQNADSENREHIIAHIIFSIVVQMMET